MLKCTSFWCVNFTSEMKVFGLTRDRLRFVAICVDDNHQQVDIADEATRVSFLPFMILSCTGLGKATISGLSRSSTALSALHTRLTAFYAECTSFWYVNFASEMKGFWFSWRCSCVYGCV